METGAVVLATDFRHAERLLSNLAADPTAPRASKPSASAPFDFDRFIAAPITTIHLWFDRELCDLDCAALLDTRIHGSSTNRVSAEVRPRAAAI